MRKSSKTEYALAVINQPTTSVELATTEKIWTKEREAHQFTFRCDSCNGEYLFKDDEVIEKTHGRNPVGETTAIHHCEIEAALHRYWGH
ncbi:MAG: hypothetical protein WB643_03955 [Candidatus Bathyarchaeia archaeon]